MRPEPVTTPSPGTLCSSMPKSWHWWTTKRVELDEGAGIEQELEALARRLLARLVLPADPLLAAAELRLGVAAAQLFESVVGATWPNCGRVAVESQRIY